jgi:hypothetical protein
VGSVDDLDGFAAALRALRRRAGEAVRAGVPATGAPPIAARVAVAAQALRLVA